MMEDSLGPDIFSCAVIGQKASRAENLGGCVRNEELSLVIQGILSFIRSGEPEFHHEL